jgi:hypothetical protein
MVAAAAAGFAGFVMAQSALAQPHPTTRLAHEVRVRCPDPAIVKITSSNTPDWETKSKPAHLHIDMQNAPRVESNTLICTYALGSQPDAFVLYRPQGARTCTVTPEKKGFVCR